jgi:hypothetical protein
MGAPPPNLEALVPRWLPEVPSTGMGAHPRWHYEVAPYVGRFAQDFAGERWVLMAHFGARGSVPQRLVRLPGGRTRGSQTINGWTREYDP